MTMNTDACDGKAALDPARSVVVEACAGSGKTWLLASRIVRLLLAGVAPGEILAITFTRKAAREIEARVIGWLRLLATENDAVVDAFLAERGIAVDVPVRQSARGLYEQVLSAQPGLTVNTFHAWFLQLIDAAPLSANLAGVSLVESDSRRFDELWQSFAAGFRGKLENPVAQGLKSLLATAGRSGAGRLIRQAYDRRSEWLALGEGNDDPSMIADRVLSSLQSLLNAGESGESVESVESVESGAALAAFFDGDWSAEWHAYLGFLEMSELKRDRESAARLNAALAEADEESRFALLRQAMLNKSGSIPVKKPGDKLDRRYTPAGAQRFLDLHARLGQRLVACSERQAAERIFAFNRDACVVFSAFLAHAEEEKRKRRQIDFVDAEWRVLQLLRDAGTSSFVQARLDARYRHVLLDEFQDTNPLQWQILRAWLDAYSDDSRPRVFLVGDPKQSIYRFRRAEPKLFGVAADFLIGEYGAIRCELDATRRNAQPIVDAVNAVFLGLPEFTPFREQTTHAVGLPGRVELLPLFGREDASRSADTDLAEDVSDNSASASVDDKRLRNPLTEPAEEPEDLRRTQEATALAEKIGDIVGRDGRAWQLCEQGVDGDVVVRPACYGDILLLVRTRNGLAEYERALNAAGIPYEAGSRGGLLTALEIRDMSALLEFLVTPTDDLKLAHVLRSPVFACSNEELMLLVRDPSLPPVSWWQRLSDLVDAGGATPRLSRAARLLNEWLQAAARLPTHDLLDRIYHESEVFSRYRLAVPENRAAAVEANLNALLLLALDIDGGRYPSLSRFVDELRSWRSAYSGDAPDEGEIDLPQNVTGRVRILTIHAAKGLEAPIVWLLDANSSGRSSDPWSVLVDWPPEDRSPRHFSFVGRKEDHDEARQGLFNAEAEAMRREELNLLYVAMTRARQVFIVSGSESGQQRENTAYRLIERGLKQLDLGDGSDGLTHGDVLPLAERTPDTVTEEAMPAASLPLPTVGELRQQPDAAARFGLLLHALLERRTEGRDDGSDDGRAWLPPGFDESECRRVLPIVERLLAAPALQSFFDPACYRRAWNEIELVDNDGRLLRIDRLVEFDEALWVLDYKSSSSETERLDAYRAQVRTYCRALAAIFPKKQVHGALIFADASRLDVE